MNPSDQLDHRSCHPAIAGFQKLPYELLIQTFECLTNCDLKNVRLVCKSFNSSAVACGFFHHVILPSVRYESFRGWCIKHPCNPLKTCNRLYRRRMFFNRVLRDYVSIFQELLSYDHSRDWLNRITVAWTSLFPLSEALSRLSSHRLSKLTIFLHCKNIKSNSALSGSDFIATAIRCVRKLQPRVFSGVKELSIFVASPFIGSDTDQDAFQALFNFMGIHTPNIEKLSLFTSWQLGRLTEFTRLCPYRWNHLRTLCFTQVKFELSQFAILIHSQLRLECVVLNGVSLYSLLPIPSEFRDSPWRWFFNTFGKMDNIFFPVVMEIDPQPAVWAKVKFYISTLKTGGSIEYYDHWLFAFPNVMKLTNDIFCQHFLF
jgi:hypothetical protein